MSLRRGTGVAAVGAATGSVLGIIGLKAYEVVKERHNCLENNVALRKELESCRAEISYLKAQRQEQAHLSHVEAAGLLLMQAEAREVHQSKLHDFETKLKAQMADEAYLSHVEAAGNLMMQAEAREGHLAATKALKRKLKARLAMEDGKNAWLLERIQTMEEDGIHKQCKINSMVDYIEELEVNKEVDHESALARIECEMEQKGALKYRLQEAAKCNTAAQVKIDTLTKHVDNLEEGRREDRYVINALECQVIQKEEECSAAKQGLLESQEKDNIISQLLQQLATVNRLRDQEQVQFAAERQDLYACMDLSAKDVARREIALRRQLYDVTQREQALVKQNAKLASKEEDLMHKVSAADDTIKAVRASKAAAQRVAENATKEREQLRLAALNNKEDKREVAQRLKVVEQQKQDQEKSKQLQVSNANQRREAAVNAAGNWKGQVTVLKKQTSDLLEENQELRKQVSVLQEQGTNCLSLADTPNTSSCELDNLSTSPSESHIADSNKDAGPGASRGVDEGWEIAAPRSPRRTHSNNFRKFDRAGSSGSRSLRSTASYNSAYGSA